MMAKVLIYDCDGVLADTEQFGHLPAFNQMWREFGVPWQWSVAQYGEKLAIGGGKERMASLFGDADFLAAFQPPATEEGRAEMIAAWHKRKTAIYTEMIASGAVPPRSGVRRLAREALDAGWVLGVCSTSARDSVQAVLAHTMGEDVAGRFALLLAGDVVKAKKPIVIDGRLNDADWKRAKAVRANFVWDKKNVLSKTPRMTARYLWDDHYLYIGYEIFDTNLQAKASGTMDGPPDNQRPGCEALPTNRIDIVEFHIVFEDRNFFWNVQHNASNHFNDGICIVGLPSWTSTKIAFASFAGTGIYWAWGEHIQDEGDRKLACATSLSLRKDGGPSTVNDSSDVDTGYTGELRLPWFGIGAPMVARTPGAWKMTGREISILAGFHDGDADGYFTSSPHMAVYSGMYFFAEQPESFPRYVFKAFSPWAW